jgi:hypothetical protein
MDRDEVIEAIMVMMESYDDDYLNQILDQITATLH